VTPERSTRLLRVACLLTLVALALMVWSLLEPTPMPVIVAMSIGQALGTLSLLAYLAVVIADLRRRRPDPAAPPPPP
jgi:hypothetical protein